MFITAAIILLAVIFFFIRKSRKENPPPPGPFGFPFIGIKPFLALKIFFPYLLPKISENQYYKDMKKKYGDIWSLNLGDRRVIFLASYDTIMDAIYTNGKLFSNRSLTGISKIMGEEHGVVFANGELWNHNRQLMIKALRDFGMGTSRLENKISEEVEILMEYIEQQNLGLVISPKLFTKSLSNVINTLAFNQRNQFDDVEFEKFMDNIDNMFHSYKCHNILTLFSGVFSLKLMEKIFPDVSQFVKSTDQCMEFIKKKCQARIEIESEYSKPVCIFDYFWRYCYQDYPSISYNDKFFDIYHSIFDLYFTGIDTASNALGFSFFVLGLYCQLQDELRNELKDKVDDSSSISMEMRKDCPKLLSFIDEIYRFCVLGPRILRQTQEDCVFRNYEIKARDEVIYDLGTIFKDPDLFENPEVFNPYRFLDETRTKYVPSKFLIPFGLGKRVCIGESIAVMELFLFISKMLLKFKVLLPAKTRAKSNDIIEGSFGLIHAPLDHELTFRKL